MAADSKLRTIKETRRNRLASLLDEYGKTTLAEMTDISGDYLWQMGKGVGKSGRGVNDENAAKIERGAGKAPGWLSGEDVPSVPPSQSMRLDPDMIRDVALVLQSVFKEDGKVYRVEEYPELFAEFYEERANLGNIRSSANAVRAGKWIERNARGNEDGGATQMLTTGNRKKTTRDKRKT